MQELDGTHSKTLRPVGRPTSLPPDAVSDGPRGSQPYRRRLPSVRALTTLIVVAPAALVSIALIAIATITSRGIAERLGLEIVNSATNRVTSDVSQYLDGAVRLSDLYVRRLNDSSIAPTDLTRWKTVMFHDLSTFTDVASICFSTPNGDCTWLLHAHGRLELGIVDGSRRDQAVEYPADAFGNVDQEKPIRIYHYDATHRPWFQLAQATASPVWTPVYFWFGEQGSAAESGTGYTRKVLDKEGKELGVLVIDVTLSALSERLRQLPIAASGHAFIVDDQGLLVAASDGQVISDAGKRLGPADSPSPAARAVASLVSFEAHGAHVDAPRQQTLRVFIGEEPARAQVTEIKPFPGIHWHVVTVLPESSFLAAAKSLERRAILLGFAAISAGLAAGLLFSRRLSRPLVRLADHVGRVGAGDFDSRLHLSSAAEFERLSDEVNRMAGGLKQRMQLESAISVATQVQQSLLPMEIPYIPGLDIAVCSKYCDSTGGDYYDFIDLPGCASPGVDAKRQTVIAVGDVTGHGIGAALVMATARGAVRSSCQTGTEETPGGKNSPESLGHILARVNQVLTCGSDGRKYMTLVLLAFDPAFETVRWSSAGHDPTIVYHPDTGAFDELESEGIPLGIDAGIHYGEFSRASATPGAIFLIGTDGIWEARNADGDMFGKDRLCDIIRANGDGSAETLSSAIKSAMHTWIGPRPLQDDVTFVAVKVVS